MVTMVTPGIETSLWVELVSVPSAGIHAVMVHYYSA